MISQDSYNYESFTQWYDSSFRPELLSGFINSPKVGNPAPDFEALTSDGYKVKSVRSERQIECRLGVWLFDMSAVR